MFPPLSLLVDFAIASAAVLLAAYLGTRGSRPRQLPAVLVAALHPTATVLLFYSLALHMHGSLGGWPNRLGLEGFPTSLRVHAEIASHAFGSLLLACLFVCPFAAMLCSLLPRLRGHFRHVGIYAVTALLSLGATQLAPAPFLSWWWD